MDHVRVPRGLELVFLERDGLLPEADFEEHDTKSVDVMDLAEQLLRRPLPVWMPVDVPLEAVVREPVREVHLRPAVLEPKHERLLP